MRFSLTETVQDVETPLAIDKSGRQVFLITDAGLTVADLGMAPLSIGSVSPDASRASWSIEVNGSGFVADTTVAILVVTVPAGAAGLKDITLTNPDGTTYTLVSGFSIQ